MRSAWDCCVLSSLWPSLSSGEAYWGNEQQAQFTEALQHAHELEMRKNTGKRQTAATKEAQEQELAAAQEHLARAKLAKLAEAKAASKRPAKICFWAGLVVTLGACWRIASCKECLLAGMIRTWLPTRVSDF